MAKHTSKDGKGLVVRAANPPGEALLTPEVLDVEKLEANIDRMADQLFVIRHDQSAIERWTQSLGNRWKLGVKGKDVEKMAKFASQATMALKNMIDVQGFKNQLKVMYFEGLRKELETQAELLLVGELAREKMRLEIKKVQREIKKIDDEIAQPSQGKREAELQRELEKIRLEYKLKGERLKAEGALGAKKSEWEIKLRKNLEKTGYPPQDIEQIIADFRQSIFREGG
jgi:hypothetical protein